MTRPWIEFLQAQKLPWRTDDLNGTKPGVETKVLSQDDETGASSQLIRYPAGWTLPAGALACDEEFLVLEGALEIGGVRYGPFGYAHWPAGHDAGARTCTEDAVVLSFFSAMPTAGPVAAVNPARLVPHIDGFSVTYTGNFHPEFPAGAGRKLLFVDPETGDTSWLLGTLPMRWAERAEVHPVVEEMFLLAGESHGNRGVMKPGAYFWRPPLIPHGPYGTITGNLYFFRTKGGKLSTDYVDGEKGFAWNRPYEPALPETLAAHAGDVETLERW
ncbi:cupin domain-containing protein [Polymorphobacter sp.]|uniref:cupin domain-containing protein n=1 Tax=Polymorphobacter sp. TaxID=1909290 RepID=UPI003F72529A